MTNINWKSEEEKKSSRIKNKINESDTLINDDEILKAFKIPLKDVLSYVKESFLNFSREKSEECIILITLAYLYKPSEQKLEDIEFIEFTIEKLIQNEDYLLIGLISLHLLLNKYEILDLKSFLKEIPEEKRVILKNIIVNGLISKKSVNLTIPYISKVQSVLNNRLKVMEEKPSLYIFEQIMLNFPELLLDNREVLLNYINRNKSLILSNRKILTISAHLYKNYYEKGHHIFTNLENLITESIKKAENIENLSDFFHLLGNNLNAANLLRKNKDLSNCLFFGKCIIMDSHIRIY